MTRTLEELRAMVAELRSGACVNGEIFVHFECFGELSSEADVLPGFEGVVIIPSMYPEPESVVADGQNWVVLLNECFPHPAKAGDEVYYFFFAVRRG